MRQLFETAVSWSYDGPAKGGLHHAHYPGRVANKIVLLKWTSRAAAPVFANMLFGLNSARAAASQSQIPCADGKARQRIHVTLRKPTKPRKEIAMMQPTPNETRTHADELVDIREVSVDKNLPKEERIAAFIRQIKNPYRFRCGDFVVNACFAGNGVTLEECLQGILR